MADKSGKDLVVTGREAQQVGTHQMYLAKYWHGGGGLSIDDPLI